MIQKRNLEKVNSLAKSGSITPNPSQGANCLQKELRGGELLTGRETLKGRLASPGIATMSKRKRCVRRMSLLRKEGKEAQEEKKRREIEYIRKGKGARKLGYRTNCSEKKKGGLPVLVKWVEPSLDFYFWGASGTTLWTRGGDENHVT